MQKFLGTVMCAVLLMGPVFAEETASDAVSQAEISPEDIEIINNLDMLENWDDLQNEQALETTTTDEAITGEGYEQQG